MQVHERSVALAGKPDGAVAGGRDVVQADARVDRKIFDPERAFLRAGASEQGGRGNNSSGGRDEKLAAIHCVTPALGEGRFTRGDRRPASITAPKPPVRKRPQVKRSHLLALRV